MDRKAEAHWSGALKTGNGRLKLESGAFEGPYSFHSRFEGGGETNPEELLGAAHAGCFTMALSHALAEAGHVPTSVDTTATVRLEKGASGLGITGITLTTRGVVPGIDEATFVKMAKETGVGCIVSRALSAVPITVDATLAS